MLFPIHIEQYNRKPQLVTWALIIINIIVFWWEKQIPSENLRPLFLELLVVSENIVANPFSLESFLDIVRSTFMHASWGHLIGNMLYLHLFGTNVERRIGSWLFLLLYLLAGFVAALLHVVAFPKQTIPLLGASGAIAGAMGLFLVLFPKSKIQGLFPIGAMIYSFFWPLLGSFGPILFFFIWPAAWSAWIFLGIIIINDTLGAIGSLAYPSMGGVAHFGHLGGFIAGASFGIMICLALLTKPKKRKAKKPRNNIYLQY